MCRDGAVDVTVGDQVDGTCRVVFQGVGAVVSGCWYGGCGGGGGIGGEGCGALLEEVRHWSCKDSSWAGDGACVLLV